MDAEKRKLVEKKFKKMDSEFWGNAVQDLNSTSLQVESLHKSHKEALSTYCIICMDIAETRYNGYKALLKEGLSAEDEKAVKAEFKEKLTGLDFERHNCLYQSQLKSAHTALLISKAFSAFGAACIRCFNLRLPS